MTKPKRQRETTRDCPVEKVTDLQSISCQPWTVFLLVALRFGEERQSISVSMCLRHELVGGKLQRVSLQRWRALPLHGHSVGIKLISESILGKLQSAIVPVLLVESAVDEEKAAGEAELKEELSVAEEEGEAEGFTAVLLRVVPIDAVVAPLTELAALTEATADEESEEVTVLEFCGFDDGDGAAMLVEETYVEPEAPAEAVLDDDGPGTTVH